MNSAEKLARLAAQLLRIALRNPKRLSHVFGSALAATEDVANPMADLLAIPEVTVEDILPDQGKEIRATLALFPRTHAAISNIEFVCLILLLHRSGGRNIFEFGTYKGVSITQLALNALPGGAIYTLDLPEDDPRSHFAITDPEDIKIALEKGKGDLVPGDVRGRVQFLRQDSATFDPAALAGTMDFVFVDGAHNAAYVRNDSEKAWKLLRSGGIVAWHDCRPADAAVVQYLLESSYRPKRIAGTTLAFARKD